jgi:hypothetical protein
VSGIADLEFDQANTLGNSNNDLMSFKILLVIFKSSKISTVHYLTV